MAATHPTLHQPQFTQVSSMSLGSSHSSWPVAPRKEGPQFSVLGPGSRVLGPRSRVLPQGGARRELSATSWPASRAPQCPCATAQDPQSRLLHGSGHAHQPLAVRPAAPGQHVALREASPGAWVATCYNLKNMETYTKSKLGSVTTLPSGQPNNGQFRGGVA